MPGTEASSRTPCTALEQGVSSPGLARAIFLRPVWHGRCFDPGISLGRGLRPPHRLSTNAPTRTTCPYCGVGCGVLATRRQDKVEIRGDPSHPANLGKLCVKGSALGETVGLEDRLLYPQLRGQRVSWSDAVGAVAGEFRRCIESYGPDSVALYVSGQLLTEDYYVANKLMKGYVGTANIDTNSRLCMSSAVAGHKRAFGEDLVPVSYDDLDTAELVVLVGSNTAWCHPVLLQRLIDVKQRHPERQLVVIDPRRTATCEFADLHLPLRAGTDVWLFNGLLAYLADRGLIDDAFIAAHTNGAPEAIVAARASAGTLRDVARICGVDVASLERFYDLYARH